MVIVKDNKEKYVKCMACHSSDDLIKAEVGKTSGNRTGIYICRACANELSEKLKRYVSNVPPSQK